MTPFFQGFLSVGVVTETLIRVVNVAMYPTLLYLLVAGLHYHVLSAMDCELIPRRQKSWEPGLLFSMRKTIVFVLAPLITLGLAVVAVALSIYKEGPRYAKWLFTPPGDAK